MKHDLLAVGRAGDEPVGKNKVGEELEAGVIEHDVDARALERREMIPGGGQVVVDDPVTAIAGVVTLEGFDVGVGEAGEEGEVARGVAPELGLDEVEEGGVADLVVVLLGFDELL
jgi:hypothetical protein